ncbi:MULTISPECIES: arylamine N-acetyltransferase family protein [Pseudomonas]|jgi:N-hydroxyarylamine O-acetyltransferase|uniref:N-hydroxyarylamine O-acetyltransferase n=1 Tax=Pseudomonas extremorientalis TaxID=169669 RepID=A0A1H0L8Y4_9PSED|nr:MULTISPECIES: arylamine N-acetyltransferase [Pseudomonas]KAB0517436.1 arylamine N-acetyltransferase [Pseudomonas extremorientalis]OIN05132.1 N-hydroxyarylamine O-acetyltransferase [Pseudomonas extremorientalis]QZP23573.1 arylamine N-acetyltransferase [Pseudomonas sp. DR208]UUN86631.1 arylamine N-acetyltransferase [Pseudomonas extremorientalis]SDO64516.1 N-hydroxyarylamine O-acetyltransferase [Pseudomonas extremorientalis]
MSLLTHSRLYLQRLGYDTPPAPTLHTLQALQLRHVCSFAFENLSSLIRLPVPIDLPSVEQKVLLDGRGGYCYELNQMFLALLQELGFEARGITGRVVMGGAPDARTARTHRLSLVTLDGVRYITDVGFGGMVPSSPLQLDTEAVQATAHEPYRLTFDGQGSYTLWAQVAEEWRGLYVFDLQVQADIDYEIGNWYVSTHPDSVFVGQLKVARLAPGKRHTLNNTHYAIHSLDRPSEKRTLGSADEVVQMLTETFRIRVPDTATLRQTLDGLVLAASRE